MNTTANNSAKDSKTVVFITGAFVNNSGWEPWKAYFESKGYKTLAPAWPNKDGSAAELRARRVAGTDTALATMHFSEVIDHYAAIVQALPERPILIGHSLGGMITQILLNRGLGAAGIAIHPAPPQGIIPYEFSFLKAGFKPFGLFTSTKKTSMMNLKDWAYAFTNGMTPEEQKASYEAEAVPESKTVVRDGLTKMAYVDFKKAHAPLLITSGSEDNIIPAHLNYRNFKRYSQTNGSVTEYKEFPGRNHYVLGQKTWKEDADYILEWIARH